MSRCAALAAALLVVACGVKAPPRPPAPDRGAASPTATAPGSLEAVRPERSDAAGGAESKDDAASAAERSRGTTPSPTPSPSGAQATP